MYDLETLVEIGIGLVKVQLTRDGHAKKVLHLLGCDENRGAGGKAHDHRVGNEVHQDTQPGEPHHELDNTHHEGEGQRIEHEVVGTGYGEDAQRRVEHDRGGGGRPRDQEPRRAEQRRDDSRDHRRVQTVFGWHTRDSGEHDALGEHDDGAGQTRHGIAAQG